MQYSIGHGFHFSSQNLNSRYGSIFNTVAMLNSSSSDKPRFIPWASTEARCWRLPPNSSANCSCDGPFCFRYYSIAYDNDSSRSKLYPVPTVLPPTPH